MGRRDSNVLQPTAMRQPVNLKQPHAAAVVRGSIQLAFPLGNGNRPIFQLVWPDLANNGGRLLRRVSLIGCLQLQGVRGVLGGG